ncbi:hypothetical protein GQ600_17039 [Phytophthora cactorum]|nr:hypothetical protein GQ600_17039 [Phytophthora cactorum]
MRLSSTALVAVFTALLSCVDSASVSAASDTTTADFLPAKLRVLPGFATNRLLRASETNDKNNEDRVMNAAIEKLTGLVKTGAMKINGNTSLIGMFSARYGDDVVAETLVLARADRAKKPLAINLQQQQFQEWQKSKKSADDVFKLLKIQSQDFAALISPKLETVSEYIKALKATDPGDTSDLLTVVINGVGGEGVLSRAVVRLLAMINSRDPPAAAVSTAAEYELMLFKRWRKGDIKPKSIYRQVLDVDEASAGRWENAIVTRYTAYYNDKKASSQVNTVINPRRS